MPIQKNGWLVFRNINIKNRDGTGHYNIHKRANRSECAMLAENSYTWDPHAKECMMVVPVEGRMLSLFEIGRVSSCKLGSNDCNLYVKALGTMFKRFDGYARDCEEIVKNGKIALNDDSSYDVELLGFKMIAPISMGLLEEELFEFVEEPAPLERKHKDVLYRFARKILANRNMKKIKKRQTELGKLILKISKSLGTGLLTNKIGLAMITRIKEHIAPPQTYSEIQQAIRLEKLDQVLKDAKSVISLSHERLYDKKTKQKLLSLTSLWKKPVEEEKEEKDLQDYVTKQTTFDSVML